MFQTVFLRGQSCLLYLIKYVLFAVLKIHQRVQMVMIINVQRQYKLIIERSPEEFQCLITCSQG
jgi:hypothetical protein